MRVSKQSQRQWRWLAAIAALLAAPAALGAGVALVADVVGEAQYERAPVKLLAELPRDAELRLKPGAEVVLFYRADGAQWTIRGPGNYRLQAAAPRPLQGAKPGLQKPAKAQFRPLRAHGAPLAQGVAMRGRSLVAPVNEVVLTPNVVFSWERFGDGVAYQLELVDSTGNRIFNAETQATELALPASIELAAGQQYFWSLRGRESNGSPAFYRAADFHVADAATRQRLLADKPADDAPFADRALYVALLDEAGMRSTAQTLRRKMAIERPVSWAALD